MKLSQQGSFLWDNQNKGSQPYVLTIITHNPKYLDQFLIVLHETFTSGMCNYVQNIGLWPLALIVSQKQALLWKFHIKPSRIGQDI